ETVGLGGGRGPRTRRARQGPSQRHDVEALVLRLPPDPRRGWQRAGATPRADQAGLGALAHTAPARSASAAGRPSRSRSSTRLAPRRLPRPRGRGRGDGRSQLPAVVGPGIKRLPGAVDYRPRMHRTNRHLLVWGLLLAAACGTAPLPATLVAGEMVVAEHDRLPTGVRLDPVGEQHDLRAAMPLTMLLAPGGRSVVIS